jgi:prepilin-type N-terminal cleavage/methylation domain-containing protein
MKSNQGFTLIELLVVIAIIGILSSTVMTSVNTARDKSKIAQAKAQLRNIRSGMAMLESDTGKTLNGCPIGTVNHIALNEKDFNDTQLGLVTKPNAVVTGNECNWTEIDRVLWNGPYIKSPLDPWGNQYVFEPDYIPYSISGGCTGHPVEAETVVIVSYGPNGEGLNDYDCDDIFYKLQ